MSDEIITPIYSSYCVNCNGYTDADLVSKVNELIEVVNKQDKKIKELMDNARSV